MKSNQKVTIALTALLMLSMLAFAVPAYATPVATASVITGTVGTKVTVSGTSTNLGGTINVYWDALTNLLGTTTVAGAGTFSVNVNIPDATGGVHYLLVSDGVPPPQGIAFTVNPQVTVTPVSGLPGDVVNITGNGFAGFATGSAASNITVALVNALAAPTYNQTIGIVNATATGNFSILATIPATPVPAYGAYFITATDQSAPARLSANAAFTIGAVVAVTSPAPSPVTGLSSGPAGTVVTIAGRGFTKTAGLPVTVTFAGFPVVNTTTPRTDATGAFTATFVVPTLVANGTKTISATDGAITGTASFRLTQNASITVPTSAAPGATITVTGQNFAKIAGNVVTINFGTTASVPITLGTVTIPDTSGAFTTTVTVPNLPTVTYVFNATDQYQINATSTFTIAITALIPSPASAVTGSTVALTGFGLGLTGATTFNVTLTNAAGNVTLLTPSSNLVTALNAGTTTVTLPTMPAGTYTLAVTDANGLTASSTFTIAGTSSLSVNPSTAPSGTTSTIILSNFAPNTAVTFSIYNSTYIQALPVSPVAPFVALTTNASGMLVASFTIPTLAQGLYTINASDVTNTFNASAPFSIGPATLNLNTRASTYMQGDTVSFNIQSSFATTFAINIYDPQGAPSVLNIIADPVTGAPWILVGNIWVYPIQSGQGISWSQFNSAIYLPSDAVVGTWTWNATVLGAIQTGSFNVTARNAAITTNNTDITAKLDALNQTLLGIGSNVTSIKGNVITIQTNLGTVTTTLQNLNGTIIAINGNVATLQTSIGTVTTSINSMTSAVSGITGTVNSISSGMATIQTSLGTITTKLDSIDPVIGAIAGDTTTIKTSLGTITTSLSSIGTTVTSIQGNVATIQTDIGTIKGTVTDNKNGIATIQTSLGTMQANVGNLQSDVSTIKSDVSGTKTTTETLSPLVIVAIVLALIAAIAAIASIVMMRRKIAG